MQPFFRCLVSAFILLVLSTLPRVTVGADDTSFGKFDPDKWCDSSDNYDSDWVSHCEVREFTLDAARTSLSVDGGINGSIKFEGWDRNEIRVFAKVQAWARKRDEAKALAAKIDVETDGATIQANGPQSSSKRRASSWGVTFRIFVPRKMALSAVAHNGGISVRGVTGRMRLETLNGGLALDGVAGDVRGRTTNGGLSVTLDGKTWRGEGLDLRTTNGGVELEIPEGYSARLETGTTNGNLDFDFPITLVGTIGRRIETDLGAGGPLIRAMTTNGGVSLARAD